MTTLEEINTRLTRIETMISRLCNPAHGMAAEGKRKLVVECINTHGPKSKQLKALMKELNGEELQLKKEKKDASKI